MTFTGYPKESLKFFTKVKRNNRREWWPAHKAEYAQVIELPTQNLIVHLLNRPTVKKLELTGDPKKSLFRMHRDVRFTHDKSPLKTSNGFLLSRNGTKNDQGVLYVHLEPKKCFFAVGFWQPPQSLLSRFRLEIVENQSAFRKQLSQLSKHNLKLDQDDKLKRVPRGFEAYKESPVAEDLKLKHIITSEPFADMAVESKAFAQTIDRFLKKAAPLLMWGWPIVNEWREEGGEKWN